MSQLEANIARVQQKMLEDAEQSDLEDDVQSQSDEKRGRGRPKKHKPNTVDGMAFYYYCFFFSISASRTYPAYNS